MDKYAKPLDYLIQCCEKTLVENKSNLDKFIIENAKDELKRLRHQVKELMHDQGKYKIVAWAKINKRGDLFDLRRCYNEHNKTPAVSLYVNNDEIYWTLKENYNE
jgi:hypothetical protein